MAIQSPEALFIGTILEHFLFGTYTIVFGLYIQILRRRKARLRVVDYGIFALFAMTLAMVIIDSCQQFQVILHGDAPWVVKVNSAASTFSITLDFLSQVILIYRCWIVWGGRWWVISLPSLLALASWVTGLTVTIDMASWTDEFLGWWVSLGSAAMTLSLATNAIVSALMIGRILYVYQLSHGASHGTARRASWAASVFLESAIAMFFAQLVFTVLYKIQHVAFSLVVAPVTVIYGLNCTAIMVRVGMNHSYETTVVRESEFPLRRGEVEISAPSSQGGRSEEKLESHV